MPETVIRDAQTQCSRSKEEMIFHQNYKLFCKGRTTTFDRGPMQKIEINELFTYVTISFADGSSAHWPCKWLSSYLFQFGIAVSKDGSCVFIQTWENGLFCLSSQTGEVIWRTESKRGITNIFVNDITVLVHQHDRALQLLDIHTGKVLKEKRPATAWGFTALDHGHVICQVTARRWEILDPQSLDVVASFTHKQFTGDHTDYCVRDIRLLEDGSIQVSGFQNVWDKSDPKKRLPNLEFTHLVPTTINQP